MEMFKIRFQTLWMIWFTNLEEKLQGSPFFSLFTQKDYNLQGFRRTQTFFMKVNFSVSVFLEKEKIYFNKKYAWMEIFFLYEENFKSL